MEDHDFQVVRKNLNILSVLIIVLAFTNAKINTLNFLGIDMQLDGAKFYQALFIGYLYFIWRYCTKLDLRAGFWNDFVNYFISSEEGVKSVHNFKKYENRFKSEISRFSQMTNDDPNWRLVATNITRHSESLSNLTLSITIHTSSEIHMRNPNFEIDIKVSWKFRLKKFLIFCFRKDKFGDYLFPFVPVILNLLFLLFKTEWQGSLRNIFN